MPTLLALQMVTGTVPTLHFFVRSRFPSHKDGPDQRMAPKRTTFFSLSLYRPSPRLFPCLVTPSWCRQCHSHSSTLTGPLPPSLNFLQYYTKSSVPSKTTSALSMDTEFLWNLGIHLRVHTVSQNRRTPSWHFLIWCMFNKIHGKIVPGSVISVLLYFIWHYLAASGTANLSRVMGSRLWTH
jgi:hypothetical protein